MRVADLARRVSLALVLPLRVPNKKKTRQRETSERDTRVRHQRQTSEADIRDRHQRQPSDRSHATRCAQGKLPRDQGRVTSDATGYAHCQDEMRRDQGHADKARKDALLGQRYRLCNVIGQQTREKHKKETYYLMKEGARITSEVDRR